MPTPQQRNQLELLLTIKRNNASTLEALKELAPLNFEAASDLFTWIKSFVRGTNDAHDALVNEINREPQ
jgi:hypothetical protein